MIGARNIKTSKRKESIEFRNRNREKCARDNVEYEDDKLVIKNDQTYAGTPEKFPWI